MTKGGIIPTSIEFMDQLSIKGACDYLNETIPYEPPCKDQQVIL